MKKALAAGLPGALKKASQAKYALHAAHCLALFVKSGKPEKVCVDWCGLLLLSCNLAAVLLCDCPIACIMLVAYRIPMSICDHVLMPADIQDYLGSAYSPPPDYSPTITGMLHEMHWPLRCACC